MQSGTEGGSSFSTLCVLIVVDTVGALASGGLKNNCYMVDNNHYLGSWKEGSEELHTVCQDGQQIVWDVVSVSPETPIAIAGFSGRMVEEGTCAPKRLPDGSWAGRVESRGVFAAFPYTVTLSINQKTEMKATCFIKVV
ncbi:MAG: alpha-pore-forming tripartite toxin MakABE regulator [Solirubrobacterales bacterium]